MGVACATDRFDWVLLVLALKGVAVTVVGDDIAGCVTTVTVLALKGVAVTVAGVVGVDTTGCATTVTVLVLKGVAVTTGIDAATIGELDCVTGVDPATIGRLECTIGPSEYCSTGTTTPPLFLNQA